MHSHERGGGDVFSSLLSLVAQQENGHRHLKWNVHRKTGMYMFDLNQCTESADSMGDRRADSHQTCTFQCFILTGDLSKIGSAWS